MEVSNAFIGVYEITMEVIDPNQISAPRFAHQIEFLLLDLIVDNLLL